MGAVYTGSLAGVGASVGRTIHGYGALVGSARHLLAGVLIVLVSGCLPMVGPDYVQPPAPLSAGWMEAKTPGLTPAPAALDAWWTALRDPPLSALIERAYHENPTLRVAGVRVLEAQARRGIAIGQFFPQTQQANASYTTAQVSLNSANQGLLQRSFDNAALGFDAAWEIDLWGKFRRGIESADASLLASVASYDDVLVSLLAEVAAVYVQHRVFEARHAVVEENIKIQRESYRITEKRFREGMVSGLDVEQATVLLKSTEALLPLIEAGLQQTENTLCILLGVPPQDLSDLLGASGKIPEPSAELAIGIPADLLRRRPDIRQAERELAAQSAQIGVAKADLFPAFSLVGSINLDAEDVKDLFEGHSVQGFGGPSVRWAILNYGRISNNVRVQDAVYQQLISSYEATVLRAQLDLENSLAGYLRNRERVALLGETTAAASRAVNIADLQYREGAVDFVRVLNAQEAKLSDDDQLIQTRGDVVLNLIATYKGLGGGWEIRTGQDFVPAATMREMGERTNWGGLLSPQDRGRDLDRATSDQSSRKWRWWWPKW